MKVTLVEHSCVLIELSHHSLLFDCYDTIPDIDRNKPLYIFHSHGHYDHYNHKVFNIVHPDKHYILSDDIYTKEDVLRVSPHHTYRIDGISIKTLFSTDLGVAFIIHCEGQVIYFAGDLNWWHWEGEPEEDNLWQKKHYLEEIQKIQEPIDLACIVVDDRQEKDMYLGIDAFLKYNKTRYVLPIHYFKHYRISEMLKGESFDSKNQTTLLYPTHDHSTFII